MSLNIRAIGSDTVIFPKVEVVEKQVNGIKLRGPPLEATCHALFYMAVCQQGVQFWTEEEQKQKGNFLIIKQRLAP